MNACIRSGVLSRSFWASSGLASLPLRGSCACGARLRLRRSRCHCVAADGGVSPPPRRAGRPFPHGLPAPTGGPVEQRYPSLWPVPVLLAGRSTAHPCAGLALGNVLLPRPTISPDAVAKCCVISSLLKRGYSRLAVGLEWSWGGDLREQGPLSASFGVSAADRSGG